MPAARAFPILPVLPAPAAYALGTGSLAAMARNGMATRKAVRQPGVIAPSPRHAPAPRRRGH